MVSKSRPSYAADLPSGWMDHEGRMIDQPERTSAIRAFRMALMVIAALVGVSGILMLVAMWRPALVVGTPREAVSYSLGASAGSGTWRSPDNCESAGDRDVTCTVAVPLGDSGTIGVRYEVSVARSGCWHARQVGADRHPTKAKNRLTDCLGVRDFLQPLEAPERYGY